MALVVSDRVKETTTSTGTGTINLGGAINGSFETFVAGVGDGNTTYYAIIDTVNGDFEVGLGTVADATPDTLSRDTVLESSNSDNKVNFSAGTKTVICTQPADKAVYLDSSGNLVVGGSAVDYLDKSGGTMTGALTLSGAPTDNNHAVTKTYVDDLIAAGIHYHTPVRVESPDSEGNLNATYNNGTSGVGATLTNAGTQAALVIDGVTLVLNDRVLIYNQTDATENGIYTVTNVGSASTNWVLTRATDADSYGVDNDSLSEGTSVFVLEGNEGSGEVYACTTTGTITFGTTAINFAQIGRSAVLQGGTGITVSDNTISVTDNSIGATQLNVSGNGDTTKFLRSDGDGTFSWAVPADTDTVPNNATICICANQALCGGGTFTVDQSSNSTICINHCNTSSLSGCYGGMNNGIVIEDITIDGNGHVTGIGTRQLCSCYDNYGSWTVSDGTNSEAIGSGNTLTVCGSGASSVAYDTATNTLTVSSTDNNDNDNTTYGLTAEQTGGTNANPNLVLDGSSGTDSCVQLVGSGATTVTRNCDGKITISSTDNNDNDNTTYSLCAAQTGGNNTNPNIFLDGSAGTDSCLQLAGSGATNVTRTCDGKITISSTDTNTDTTYTAGCGLTLNGTEFDANVSATQQTTGANTVTSTASRTYAVQVDGSDNLVVNVPWSDTDTNTTYTAGTNLCLNGTEFNVCGTVPTATSASCATGAIFNATCVDATNVYASAVLETPLIQSNDYSCNVCDITIQPGRSLYVAPNAGASIFCCVNGATNVVCLDCGVNLCVGGGTGFGTSSAKVHGLVCSQGFIAHQFHDLTGCDNYVRLNASEAYSIDHWLLEGVGNGIISTCSTCGIRFQHGHGALFQPYLYEMKCICHDFYICSTGVNNGIKFKICNTGTCTVGAHCATVCLQSNAVNANLSFLHSGTFRFNSCYCKGVENFVMGHCTGTCIDTNSSGHTHIGVRAGQCVGGTSTFHGCSTAVGYYALRDVCSPASAYGQTAIGAFASRYNAGAYNTVIGYQAGCGSSTTSASYSNTFIGGFAAYRIQTGISNVAIGFQSAGCLREGGYNIAIGVDAGCKNYYLNGQVAIGFRAGCGNCLYGGCNVYLGYEAGRNNQCSFGPTVVLGFRAGCGSVSNSMHTYSVAVGSHANYQLVRTCCSVAIGAFSAGAVRCSLNNVFIGYCAGANNGAGSTYCCCSTISNIFIGACAGSNGGPGRCNTVIGVGAGYRVSCGTNQGCNNTLIGYGAGACQCFPGFIGLADVTGTCSNMLILGNCLNTCSLVKVAWTTVSDCRDKSCFSCVPHGLDFVRALKPTAYKFKCNGRNNPEVEDKTRYGFLAQDVLALEGDNPVIVTENAPESLGLSDQHLIPVLVNAIKELASRVETLESCINA